MLGRLKLVPVLVSLAFPAWAGNVVNKTAPVPQPGSAIAAPAVNPLSPGNAGIFIPARGLGSVLQQKRLTDTFKTRSFFNANFDGNSNDPKPIDAIVETPIVRPVVAPEPAQPGTGTGTGRELLNKLHEETGRKYTAHSYDTARDYMYGTADQVTVNSKRGLLDPYSGVFVQGRSQRGGDYPEPGDANGDGVVDHKGFNAEHIWPQSFFEQRAPMRSDLHHLMATLIHTNEIRGHLAFGEVQGKPEYTNRGGAKMGEGVFEPPDAAKGRVARAVFYFYTRYHDRGITRKGYRDDFFQGRLEMFLRWNREHPPTQFEKDRNDLVEQFQGNRNPFTDDPTLADRVGAEGFNTGYSGYQLRSDRPGRKNEKRSRHSNRRRW